jgi:beta-glucosidase
MNKRFLFVIVEFLLFSGVACAVDYSFHNTKLKDEKRVDIVLQQLTLDEKLALLSSNLGIPRLGIPNVGATEGLHGLALNTVEMRNRIKNATPEQKEMMKRFYGSENPRECFTTTFPQAYGLGETWSPECVRRVGEQMAEEARYYYQSGFTPRKSLIIFAPNADLARDPRWGRTEESFGEDAFLTSCMTVAMAKGIQGDNPRYWKAASLMKHFLANSNEDSRDSSSSNFSNRLFREYYSYPFYRGIVQGGSRAFMASYNSWNGTPMCMHPCLGEITRKEWGNNGIICTDGGAFSLLINAHHAFNTMEEGAAAVIKAGTSQFLDRYEPYVCKALEQGLITEKDIDNVIRGNIYVALKLGLLDGADSQNPYLEIGKDTTLTPPFMTAESRALAREITEKSIVLLKNSGLLPLDLSKKILLTGPYANEVVYDWYSGAPDKAITLYEALKNIGANVTYIKDNYCDKAVEMARQADVVIFCTGNHPYGTKPDWKFCPVPSDGREANDRRSLMLPDEDVVRQLYAANANTLLVLVSSFPYAINWSQENLPAIVHITHCSEEQGTALANVLFGKVNPAGRTTQTWPKDILDLPTMMDYDITHGRTYMYSQKPALYPFGYGLSYTRFNYSAPKLLKKSKKEWIVSVDVENVGKYDGDEVVQVYASFPESKVERPQKKLCAFTREMIKQGECKTLQLHINPETLSYWDDATHAFVLEKTPVKLLFAASSHDIRCELPVEK